MALTTKIISKQDISENLNVQLNKKKDYGFTDLNVSNSIDFAFWDTYRLMRIKEIFSKCDFILDFGNSSRELSNFFSDILINKKRLSVDINPQYSPDIVADICNLNMFDNESVDGIICAAMLEHIYNPFIAVSEIFRILKPGGKMYFYVPWLFKYHVGNKNFNPIDGSGLGSSDYYRFSKDGVFYLFKDFSHIELCPVRGRIETILNLTKLFGKHSLIMKNRTIKKLVRKFDNFNLKYSSGFNGYVIK